MAEVVPITSIKDTDKARWKATIRYRIDAGENVRIVYFNEICDLHFVVEKGPDWHCLIDIVVVLNTDRMKDLTIEQSIEL